jgi:hypothetical protein
VGNENLQVIEIALTCIELANGCLERGPEGEGGDEIELTVITPRASKQLFNIWMIALLLANHVAGLRR